MVLAPAYLDERGIYVEASEVEGDESAGFTFGGEAVTRELGKMGKSLKNSVSPDDIYAGYGADTLRLYEMSTGPLDAERPWNTRDIVGVYRFLQRLWRHLVDEETGTLAVVDASAPEELERILHRTIAGVRDDMDGLRFNTAVAKLIELNNALGPVVRDLGGAPRGVAEALVQMVAPLAPHLAEELWSMLGHASSIVWTDFPVADPALLVEDQVEIPVQVNGRLRATLWIAPDEDGEQVQQRAEALEAVQKHLQGAAIRKVIYVPGRTLNFVVSAAKE
jgi:leucyl-tRNA synthetase